MDLAHIEDQLGQQEISISYFDPFALFESVKNEFLSIFPLEDVRWKSPTGTTKTVPRLPITLVSETDVPATDTKEPPKKQMPFIKIIIVTCLTVDDYRSKVRPLLRRWLPVVGEEEAEIGEPVLPIIFMYANSTVTDTNIFKTVSIKEKINKDFPGVQVLELKSVYKSPREKEEFWSHLSQNFKVQVVDILKERLGVLTLRLAKLTNAKQVQERLLAREELLQLFLKFKLTDEAYLQIKAIREKLPFSKRFQLGKLEFPLKYTLDESIGDLFEKGALTKFYYLKYFFINELNVLFISEHSDKVFTRIHHLTCQFLNNIDRWFFKDENLLQFKFTLLHTVILLLPDHTALNFKTLPEIKGNLLLAERECYLQAVQSMTTFSLSFKKYPGGDYIFDQVSHSYKDEDSFHKRFIGYNQEIMSLFNSSPIAKRQRTIDVLSIEIGLLHYQRKEYENALSIFISCYEFYIESNWNLIGLQILKVFVDSLVNCTKISYIEFNGSHVPVNNILSNAYLNLLKLSKDIDERKRWWLKFLAVKRSKKEEEEDPVFFPLDFIFSVEKCALVTLSRPNVYQISLKVTGKCLPEDIKAEYVKIKLRDSKGKAVDFASTDVLLSAGTTECTLETKDIAFGEFMISSLEIKICNTTFVKEIEDTKIRVVPIFNQDNVSVAVREAYSLKLGDHALELDFNNLDSATDFDIALLVNKAAREEVYPISFGAEETVTEWVIRKGDVPHLIPYYLHPSSGTSFFITATIRFVKNGVEYRDTRSHYIQCYLPLSVSVEDVFKRDVFYFKFLFNSSIRDEPIVLYSAELLPEREERYDINGVVEFSEPIFLTSSLASDSCLQCYQIKGKEGKFYCSDLFYLKVEYNTLKEILDSLVTELVWGETPSPEWEPWKYFWEQEILSRLVHNYDKYAETHTLILEPQSLHLQKICSLIDSVAFPRDLKCIVLKFLRDLTTGIAVDDPQVRNKKIKARALHVPVEFPEYEPIFHIQFEPVQDPKDTAALHPQIGCPIPFSLTVEDLSSQWVANPIAVDRLSPSRVPPPASPSQATDGRGTYVLEVASSNEWLVQGKKKFTIRDTTTTTTPTLLQRHGVSLTPLKTGHLALPRVEVTTEWQQQARTDQRNAHDTLLVL
ncbi:transport protein particle complex II subunit TRS130 KNAG_0J02040 [Huiozyma naganishii CBS 8797]|uniref:Trafficking protein particle complex subunit 11 domain-containing protein n=1 Tax=Huiozyma naganishii (strain ATCC MYA-139 / BCRC 22969 / CBS 8797 / KCTC 17520 / NBRC 10181 / NCYC 3082 / Yp74L-3) TaxID=1071383 RepID=J7RBM2_HUIN7|nr:hypothetical protein KNAG_0J02040 [Kazachstania naganishii CBS 8797]CCK72285.1 hypothetical protein KNAG_0J02040 [Kazachstania naganishii CBS 8797]